MKKYRIVSKRQTIKKRKLTAWEVEYRRSIWREKKQALKKQNREISFGEDLELLSSGVDASEQAVFNILVRRLPEALSMLSNEERLVIYLRYFENKKLKDISIVMGNTPQTVHYFHMRALSKMRNFYEVEKKFS